MRNHFSRRGQLLTGASAIIILLGSPALAQTADADAPGAVVNRQSATGPITVDNDRADMLAQIGVVRASAASVVDNKILASASANVADTSLDGDATPPAATASSSSLSVAGRRIAADADRLVATSQNMSSAPVQSLVLRSEVGIDAGAVSSAKLGVTGNDLQASALGNQATGGISLVNGGSGGAIVSVQDGDAASGVSALDTGAVRLSANAGSDSAFDLSGNQVGAEATGNWIDDTLSIGAGSIPAPATAAPASLANMASGGPATVDALYADLGSQTMSGKVAATTGLVPASFALGVTGALNGSTAAVQGNTLAANATSNRSSHALDLRAGSISSDGAVSNVANVTNVQRDLGGDLVAATNGGTTAIIGGALSGSTLDVSRNAQSATAFANRATGNLLTVRATTIDTDEAAGSGRNVRGTAMTGSDGKAGTDAAFSVQNVQAVNGASVIATMTANKIGVDVDGMVDGSTISADANTAASVATANSAANGAAIDGSAFRSSVGVTNSQTMDGQLRGNIGDFTNRAGVTITPMGSVTGSAVRVTGNGLTGSAIGNTASNSLAVSAATFGDGGGAGDAIAGSLGQGYGAAADIGLSNYQKFGQPVAAGGAPSGLATTVVGAFGVGGDGPIDSSALNVSGNSQTATSVGNTARDRVSLTAATMPAAGSALASSQFGDGTVAATSDMQVAARSGLGNSSLSMTANTNQALAAINDADNGLTVSAAQSGAVSGGPARAEVGTLGTATISGDHVLANEQFAGGNVAASARTTFLEGNIGDGMVDSRLDLADNNVVADASANHAVNLVSVGGAAGTDIGAGLASSQMNAAAVAANSVMETAPGQTGVGAPTVDASTIAVHGNLSQAVGRGNSADNEVAVSTIVGPGAGIAAMVDSGPFETDVSAPALLVNGQSNYGAITARAIATFGMPLNASGSVSSSTLGVTGNSAVASAYGNAATNKLKVGDPGGAAPAMLVNIQSNNAPVTASVIGSNAGLRTGALASSALTLAGNQLAATAVGNIATNAIAAAR
jgi:hypothetical protein